MEDTETCFICDDCGTKEGVTERICPYSLEIYGEENIVYLCDDCYEARRDDV